MKREGGEEAGGLSRLQIHVDMHGCVWAYYAAALGSLGDPRGLDAIIAACSDKPTVRRRAVLALAPFDDPRVDEVLRAALDDRDWQVRQNAEDMLNPRG